MHTCSELAGLFLIDPAPETLFDAKPEAKSHPDIPEEPDGQEEYSTPWSKYWYRGTVPHLQSVHVSGSLGFNRLGLMLGLMSPVEVPELQKVLPSETITRKVKLSVDIMVNNSFTVILLLHRNTCSASLNICLQFLMSITS